MARFTDYLKALNERESHDIGSTGWRLAQQNIENITEELLAQGSRQMACEIVDEIYSLMELDEDEELIATIKKDIQLLRDNGFDDMVADDIEEWEDERL